MRSKRLAKLRKNRGRVMFFNDVKEIKQIVKRTGTAVFVVPTDVKVKLPGAIILQPESKTVITIEQVREVIARLSVRQTTDLIIMIRPAEKLGEDAANALLKSLDEPGEGVHFALLTDSPSSLLPTILSRAAVYFLKTAPVEGIVANDKVKTLAKRLLVAKGAELVAVAEEITKKKEGVRAYALTVISVAIEMLYKTYFITGKMAFVVKLPKFLAAYEGVERNGHVKLQIVASLI